MKEVALNENYLDLFLRNLRKEDNEELSVVYKNNLKEFYKISLDKNRKTYFLTDDNDFPLALGGAYDVYDSRYKIARIWLLLSKKANLNKVILYKYIKTKILNFQNEYDILFNYIYKSNYSAIDWLEKFNFRFCDLNCPDYKLFYFAKKELRIDIRYFAGK